jgi:hypothetical protein
LSVSLLFLQSGSLSFIELEDRLAISNPLFVRFFSQQGYIARRKKKYSRLEDLVRIRSKANW